MSADTYRLAPTASGDIVVTREQIKELIKAERLMPADLFSSEAIDEWFNFETNWRATKAELEEKIKTGAAATPEKKDSGLPRHLDPAFNKMIKDGDSPFDDGDPLKPEFDPAKNPFLRIDKMI